jgi:hypothetical protein
MRALSVVFAVPLLLYCVPSHSQTAPLAPACAQLREETAVHLDAAQHLIAQPEPGEALIYFIQDMGQAVTPPYPIASIGIDGRWVGANMGDSYFAVAVEPGWHSLCAEVQTAFPAGHLEYDHLVAEPGKVYYFHAEVFVADSAAKVSVLAPMNEEQAASMIAAYPRASSTAQPPREFVQRAGRGGLARARGQALPKSQLAVDGGPEKTVSKRSSKDNGSGTEHDSGGSPKTPSEKSAHSSEAKASRRT